MPSASHMMDPLRWAYGMLTDRQKNRKNYPQALSVQTNLIDPWIIWKSSGPRLNIKTVLSTYGDFHVKDKTAVRTSYL